MYNPSSNQALLCASSFIWQVKATDWTGSQPYHIFCRATVLVDWKMNSTMKGRGLRGRSFTPRNQNESLYCSNEAENHWGNSKKNSMTVCANHNCVLQGTCTMCFLKQTPLFNTESLKIERFFDLPWYHQGREQFPRAQGCQNHWGPACQRY